MTDWTLTDSKSKLIQFGDGADPLRLEIFKRDERWFWRVGTMEREIKNPEAAFRELAMMASVAPTSGEGG